MINGAHFLLYSSNPEADRAFLRDVLEFRSVDAGSGWLIFALPPAELAVHPAEDDSVQDEDGVVGAALYLMCDDLRSTIKSLETKKIRCSKVSEQPWGKLTTFRLPSSAQIGLYQPTHPTALELH
jgi:hypothetical protein